MAITLGMLRVFRTVADQGSLAGAASVLGRTPSALSMTLAQFEEEIGGPLFETDRKNRLTPLGLMVLDECQRATDAFDRSSGAIRRHVLSGAGLVRIAAVPSATVTLLPDAVARFRRLHPDVRLEISDVDSASVLRRIKLDEADIGILSAGIADRPAGAVIRRDELGIVCSNGGPIAGRRNPPSWDLLALEPLIANPLCGLVDHDSVRALLNEGHLEARNTTALLTFVRSGLGATILPASALEDRADGITFLVPEDPPAFRELRKIRPETRRLSPAGEAFWDAL
ncbi:LysR family transcriptional regulator [Defluviimonas sp. SAOS-178_SWC]|uniref:LysR family transcriptional regulator n=1 Tax=Defluviimonas sp. SAOS-178_SWC TaxID=3121287 RepID=UPI0032215242